MTNIMLYDATDYSEWDSFVEKHPYGELYDTGIWRRIVEKSFPHIEGKFIALREDNQIVAGLPLYRVRSWLTGTRMVSVPFGTLCDPLVRDTKDLNLLLDFAVEKKKELGCKTINIGVFKSAHLFKDGVFSFEATHKHHYVNLDADFVKLSKSFKRTVRQAFNKSKEAGLEVMQSQGESGLRSFYNLYLETRKRNRVPVQPYRFFTYLHETLGSSGLMSTFLVTLGDIIVCGGIVLKYRNRVTLEFLASKGEYLHMRPNHALVWTILTKACEEGYAIFDFGRTACEDEGLLRFKRSWGAQEADLGNASLALHGSKHAYDRKGLSWRVASFLSGTLPRPFYQTFSEYVYRHAG